MYFTENLLIEAVYRHAREVILADQRKMNPLKQASLQALISVRQTVTGYAEDYFAFSEASLEAPLNDDGVRRYQEVFSKLYPEQAAEIWK